MLEIELHDKLVEIERNLRTDSSIQTPVQELIYALREYFEKKIAAGGN